MPTLEARVLQAVLDLKEEMGQLKGISQATLDQATKTNGRVTGLETRVDCLEQEKAGRDELKAASRLATDKGRNRWRNCIAIGAIVVSAISLLLDRVFPFWK